MLSAIAVSTAVHVTMFLIALSLSLTSVGGNQSNDKDGTAETEKDDKADIVKKGGDKNAEDQKKVDMEVYIVDVPPPKSEEEGVKECAENKWYGGIGVVHSQYTQSPHGPGYIILEAVEGYPANQAGIRPGDFLLQIQEIRGEPGTNVLVTVVRDGVALDFILKRAKICTL